MTVYEITQDGIKNVPDTTFEEMGIHERADLQRLLRSQIDIISPGTLVISEEFAEWQDSKRRIDLLGIDKEANLVVIELKRTEDGGHMELQAIRYAAMVSVMTFERAVDVYADHLHRLGINLDARTSLLAFLEWDDPNEDKFAQDVRIVLVSADFSKELTTAVLWLNNRMLDIRCIRLKPYKLGERVLVNVQQVVPVPEAAEYQIQLRDKEQKERVGRKRKWDEASFLQALHTNKGQECARAAKEFLDWINPLVDEVWWGEGEQNGGFVPMIERNGTTYHLCRLSTKGWFIVWFDLLMKNPPFTEDSSRHDLRTRFNEIAGVTLTEDQITRRPSLPIEALSDPLAMEKCKSALTWMIERIKAA